MENNIIAILPIILLAIWIGGIVYCKKVAKRLDMGGSNAILAGIFLPILSVLIYFSYSFWKKTKKAKIKTLKIVASAIVILVIASAGVGYYITGTPEYSLYKLRQFIINNDNVKIEKYLDIESVADNFGESPSQSQEWINELNTSILELKEENPDKSKDASAFISTGLTGKYLKSASVSYSSQSSNNLDIALHFNDQGAQLFAEITRRNIDKKLAIFLYKDLVSSPIVQSEIINGEAIISGLDAGQVVSIVNAINEEKISTINGFKIREKTIDGDYAKVKIGKAGNVDGFELTLARMQGRYWRLEKINTVIISDGNTKLPNPEGEKLATFDWKYKGKSYSLNEKLYDSYYKFYTALPDVDVFNGESIVEKLEKDNKLFIKESDKDKTISELAQSLKSLGEENKLNENQLAELASTFVQTIPYDNERYKKRITGIYDRTLYPYEVLYINKGICQDKSYLAYLLLKEMGYGVSLFLFPDPADSHMAVGVKCPLEYSNYDSGYCFLETTSLGNKIGWEPNLSKEFGIATSKLELSDFSNDPTESRYHPLGKIEILNKIDGKEYTGIIETRATERELANLWASIDAMDRNLDGLDAEISYRRDAVEEMEDDLKKLEKKEDPSDYDKYEKLYKEYSKDWKKLDNVINDFNKKLETRNQMSTKYRNLSNSFYQ